MGTLYYICEPSSSSSQSVNAISPHSPAHIPFSSPAVLLSNSVTLTASANKQQQNSSRGEKPLFSCLINRLFHYTHMGCCFLCCPIYRCALWLCMLEIITSFVIWFHSIDFIVKTFSVLQLKDVLVALFLSGWLVTLFTSTGTLIAAQRKKNATYVMPRIVQLIGLLVVGFLVALLVTIYFSGGAATINSAIVGTYEFVALDERLNADERRDVYESLRYGFLLLILIDFFFICYTAFALAITRKYQKQLQSDYPLQNSRGVFKPVAQQDPSAPPQPPRNPNFA